MPCATGGGRQIAELLSDLVDNEDIKYGLEELDEECEDSVAHLLQWCYGRVIMDKGLQEKFPGFATRYQPETGELQRYEYGALAGTSVKGETYYQGIIREENGIN
jgi:hypothetical protein